MISFWSAENLLSYGTLFFNACAACFKLIRVSHQWCDLFYRLLHSPTRHIEKAEGGERDTQVVHVNEATAV